MSAAARTGRWLGIWLACAGPLAAQTSGAFIVRLGTDTVVIERYTRGPDRLEGWFLTRTPQVSRWHYVAELGARSTVRRFEMTLDPLPGQPAQRRSIVPDGDSATVAVTHGDSTRTTRARYLPGTVPFINQSYALLELVAMQVRAAARGAAPDSQLSMLPPGAPAVYRVLAAAVGSDSLLLGINGGLPVRLRVDSAGLILGASGRGTTQQFDVQRLPDLDFAAVAATLARPLGPLSVRDTARLTVGGVDVAIDYGRPQKRGRVVFGNLVPWGAVWRTGANAATVLKTGGDLLIGGVRVPAGSYTLWTIPAPGGWKLVLNRQTKNAAGQPLWGTEYDAMQDFVRVDMTARALDLPVEQFTIALEPQDGGALLTLSWDTVQAAIPLGTP